MPFVVQKVGTSSLPLASSSCPPELHLEALPAAAQGATCTDAATSYLLFKNRHLPIQQLLYSRIKTISMLLLFSQCFCIVVTCLTCLCSVCNLSLTAHMFAEHFPVASFSYKFSGLLQLSQDVSWLVIFVSVLFFFSRPLSIPLILHPNVLQEMTH